MIPSAFFAHADQQESPAFVDSGREFGGRTARLFLIESQNRQRGRDNPRRGSWQPRPTGELIIRRARVAKKIFPDAVNQRSFFAGDAGEPADGAAVTIGS